VRSSYTSTTPEETGSNVPSHPDLGTALGTASPWVLQVPGYYKSLGTTSPWVLQVPGYYKSLGTTSP
jgi:hypothetical protein